MEDSLLEAIVLGIVQGIAEFLPISSSGHLVIVDHLFFPDAEIDQSAKKLELNVALHLGTLFSILVVYRSDIFSLIRQPRHAISIVIATLPIVVIGLTLKDQIESAFNSPIVAGIGLVITAVFLFLTKIFDANREKSDETQQLPGPLHALLIGAFQAVAIVPGISRSGSTITGGVLVGLPQQQAARFSFLIAIPAICGAATLSLKDIFEQGTTTNEMLPLAVGLFTAFLVGLISLKWLLSVISKGRLHWFSGYCFTVGIATILWELFTR